MLPVILQMTAGISICLALTRDPTRSIVLAPLIGAIFLAAISPVVSPWSFVAVESALLLVGAVAIRRVRAGIRPSPIIIFLIYFIVVVINLLKEPYVASWMNPDEPIHLMRSKLYATTGSLPPDYPFLVHLIGGACYKLGGEWYLWYRVVLALLIPSEGALIYMIAEELGANPLMASLFYLFMNPSIIHLFEIGTYSNELLDPLILLDAYLLLRNMLAPAAIISLIIPISNTLGWIFLSCAGFLCLVMRSRRMLSLLPSAFWLLLPLSLGRVQFYASKMGDNVPLGVKLALIEGIPLDVWNFFGASFSLGLVGLLLRSSWEGRKRYSSFYALAVLLLVIIFALGSPSLCWRFILLLPPSLSISASCLIDRICSLTRSKAPLIIAVLLALSASPIRGATPYQDAIPFMYNICNEYKGVEMSSYGFSSSFPSVFGCSVARSAPLEDLLLNGSQLIIAKKSQLERVLVEKDPCFRVISSSSSVDLVDYSPRFHQSPMKGVYINRTFAMLPGGEDVIVTTAYGAVCDVVSRDPLVVRCPDLTIRRVIVFRPCYLPLLVELSGDTSNTG